MKNIILYQESGYLIAFVGYREHGFHLVRTLGTATAGVTAKVYIDGVALILHKLYIMYFISGKVTSSLYEMHIHFGDVNRGM